MSIVNKNKWLLASASGNGPTPVLETSASSTINSAGTSHSVTMPSGITAGDIIIVFASFNVATGNVSDPGGGWNYEENTYGSNTAVMLWKVATGSDTLTITTTSSATSAHVAFRISGGTTVSSTGALGPGVSASDPPNHDAGVVRNYLWLAAAHTNTADLTGSPSGYSTIVKARETGNSRTVGGGTRANRASSEDPGTFSSATDNNYVRTVAIHPL